MKNWHAKVKIEGLERLKQAIESLESAASEYENAVAQVGVKKEATVTEVAPTFNGAIEDLKLTLQKLFLQSDPCKASYDCNGKHFQG